MAPIIGHRGCAGHAPENTLAGIRDAARVGCTWVEADATLLADETVVLFHDDTLDRCCCDASGFIREQNWKDAITLDAGYWFDDGRFVGEHIPLLRDAVSCCQALDLGFNIELKTHRGEGEHLGARVAELLKESGKYLVSSYDVGALKAFHKQKPACPLGIIYDDLPQDWRVLADELEAVSIHLWSKHITQEVIDQVKATGRELYVFTVNEKKQAEKLWALGVDGLFSDLPDQLR
ncbi:glycerophosphodiester phosphodiesterase family protein [Terasakiella sp. SH-1]|uniref:glycerophosphodiester phosphodiesterase family protein n=1 Tax=Terasakiella sp. SH-1 TaxID=2560057 RepID=UPI00142F644C|nr:glycerophosphodiester phosphodiesterase family protein [Terasakiella sp. SH-1]